MITLRCTEKAAKALGFRRSDNVPAGTSPLGDWYVNLVTHDRWWSVSVHE
jgi:hypothetical protein